MRRLRFRVAAVGAVVIPVGWRSVAQSVDISILVGWAFAIAASTFCPMFLLGIWWTRLTARGAAAGMTCGMLVATAAIFTGLALGEPTTGAAAALLAQPAVVSVPIAFVVMIAVSLRDPQADRRVRRDAGTARARRARAAGGRGGACGAADRLSLGARGANMGR